MEGFNWILNLVPVLSTVLSWVKKFFSVKVMAFLLFKAILLFLFFKYLPFLFVKFYQWIYDLGFISRDSFDLSFLSSLVKPEITGLAAWLFYTLKLDTCFRILIAGATLRLGIKRLPFMPG